MWIQVRTIDGKETRTVEDLSRLTKIESLRLKIQDIFKVNPQQQRLFYRGKQVSPLFLGGGWHWVTEPTVLTLDRDYIDAGGELVVLPLVFEAVSDPCAASCFDRNSPIVVVNEPVVRSVPSCEENVGVRIFFPPSLFGILLFFKYSAAEHATNVLAL